MFPPFTKPGGRYSAPGNESLYNQLAPDRKAAQKGDPQGFPALVLIGFRAGRMTEGSGDREHFSMSDLEPREGECDGMLVPAREANSG